MTTQQIEKLAKPFRTGTLALGENDYQRLRNAEWNFLSVGFMMLFFASNYVRGSALISLWFLIPATVLTAAFGIFCVIQAYRYRKACSSFEQFCPKTLAELEDAQSENKNRTGQSS